MLIFSSDLFAFAPEDHLSRPQEQRARNLFLQVKCPVCQGQVIESSDTEIAYQLRKLIRQKITQGKSDAQIKSYLIEKYSDDILVSAPINSKTFLLWFLPLIFAVFGVILLRYLGFLKIGFNKWRN